MTTMSKASAKSHTLSSAHDLAWPGDDGALANAAQTWFAATAECQREMLDFLCRRLQADGETFSETLSCRNLADVTTIQSRWVSEAIRDYRDEGVKLMEIYSQAVNGRGRNKG